MKPRNDRKEPASVGARKRFRIDKLEERIAPKKGGTGNTKFCTANCGSDSYGASGY